MKNIDFIIRDGMPEDASEIICISNLGWQYAYKNIFSEDFINAQIQKKLNNVDRQAEWIKNEKSIYLVAVDKSGQILGFKGNTPDADGEFRTGGTYIDPEYIGMGIGRALFTEFAKRLHKMGKEKFWVRCMTDNKSMEFYKRIGGKIIDQYNDASVENKSESILEFNVSDFL